jgi:NAD(P)-dependent dehydrogenase (short-subunit alcohol dehydrogenase family)
MPTIEAYVAHCFGEGERLVAGIGILVNNAVIFAPVPFATRDCAQWHRVFDVIVVGSFAYTPDNLSMTLICWCRGVYAPVLIGSKSAR